MQGPELVERLEADQRKIETPLPVIFDSPEAARALVLWICAPHLRNDPLWQEQMRSGFGAIVCALGATLE